MFLKIQLKKMQRKALNISHSPLIYLHLIVGNIIALDGGNMYRGQLLSEIVQKFVGN